MTRGEQRARVLKRLMLISVGGCTCQTKTAELKFHSQRCTYRVAMETFRFIQDESAIGVPFKISAIDDSLYETNPRLGRYLIVRGEFEMEGCRTEGCRTEGRLIMTREQFKGVKVGDRITLELGPSADGEQRGEDV